MALPDVLARAHRALIDENPIDVVIHRTGRIEEGGGFREVNEYVGQIHGRLYQERTGSKGSEEQTTTTGIKVTERRWGFLAPAKMFQVDPATGALVLDAGDPIEIDTDLQAGAHVEDSFVHPVHGKYTLTSVYPREDLGVLWGWQAGVEVDRLMAFRTPLFSGWTIEYERRLAATLALCQMFAGQAEALMKSSAPWTDRTSHARGGLQGEATLERMPTLTKISITLSHSMEYGVWLETVKGAAYGRRRSMSPAELVEEQYAGPYAVIHPVARRIGPQVRSRVIAIWAA